MRWLFWSAVALIFYAYLGYPLWLWLRSRWKTRPVKRVAVLPTISIVMVVHNEEENLPRKLANFRALDYPQEKLEVVIVSDASTDQTNAILADHAEREGIRAECVAQHEGKACGLNRAMRLATGEIVVFTDARQAIDREGVRLLAENFADPEVGCASGELMLGDPATGEAIGGMGLYWRIEKKVRELESQSGSVVGATGALYSVRRNLLKDVPPGTILDDVYLPMEVARQGFRVVFDPRARAWDSPNLGSRREFRRKVRTLSGNYQLVQFAPWLLTFKNPLLFEFVSHKLARLVVPFALVVVLVLSMLLPGWLYRGAFVAQVVFYSLSVLAMMRTRLGLVSRAADAALTFVVLNTAALFAFRDFVLGRKTAWTR